jgi:hypothetical protein
VADLTGTVWRSKDRRESRYVRVEKNDHTYAYVRPCLPDGTETPGGRRSRVLTITYGTRQTLRGYRLVSAGTSGDAT